MDLHSKAISHRPLSFAGIKDLIPQRKNGSYEGFEDLIDRCNLWMKERTDILVVNMQSVIVQQTEGTIFCFRVISVSFMKLVDSFHHFFSARHFCSLRIGVGKSNLSASRHFVP